MSACPQCGTEAKQGDKFCNTCGTPVAAAPQAGGYRPPPQPSAYGAGGQPQPPPPAYGGAPPQGAQYPAPQRCQAGHEIAPGQSYCSQGHPIALDAMQFAPDQYGGGGGYGQPPQQPAPYQPQTAPPPYGGPQQAQPGYAPGGYGQPQQQGYNAAQMGNLYGPQGQGQGGFPGPSPYAQQPPPGFPDPAPPPQQQQPQGAVVPPPVQASQLPPTALRGFLISYQGNTKGDFWPLTGGRLAVGRSSSGDQVDIPLADATISSRHATFHIDAKEGTVAIEDTGSTNGTYVNEEHVGFNGRRDLRDGDKVRFGGFTCIVKVIRTI